MSVADLIFVVILPLLGVGMAIAFMRLALGPDLSDRVVALDLMATIMISMAAAYSIATDQPAYLDAALVLALIAFVGTVAFAYYIRRRTIDAGTDDRDAAD